MINPCLDLGGMTVCLSTGANLRSQLVVEQFEGSNPVVQLFWLLCLLPLDDLSTRFYHRLHFPFHFTQHLVQFLLTTVKQRGLNTGSIHPITPPSIRLCDVITHHALLQL